MKTELTCIVCPNSCRLEVEHTADGELKIGNALCGRGRDYARDELVNPVRTLTTTIRVNGGEMPLVSVRTDRPVPKEKLQEAVAALRGFGVEAPVRAGEILVENFLGLGVNIIATKDVCRN